MRRRDDFGGGAGNGREIARSAGAETVVAREGATVLSPFVRKVSGAGYLFRPRGPKPSSRVSRSPTVRNLMPSVIGRPKK